MAAIANLSGCTAPAPERVCETHASWVFLRGACAYKVKKPVRLAFLDYSTLERRRESCHEELRVNRELGGDIYEQVLAIVPGRDGPEFAPDGTPGAVEYALRMRRFDERDTLAGMIGDGRLDECDLGAVARRLVRFHAGAARCGGDDGAARALQTWQANLDQLDQLDPGLPQVDSARRFGNAFIGARGRELDRRAAGGLVRDGHGDLRCEHVLCGAPMRVVDRIEFDAALRCIDVGCDLAFLLMDLELAGQPEAARELLRAYRAADGDPGSDGLVWFFAAHWALVRAKVGMIAEAQHASGARDHPPAGAVRQLDLAERLGWRARGPLAVVVAGPPASGKSTLALELSRRSALQVISSDVVRKRLAGLAPTQRAPAGSYTRERTIETYRALGEEAAGALADGHGVLIDATCGTPTERSELLGAIGAHPAGLLFVECRVPLDCALARASERMQRAEHVSDATPDVVRGLFAAYERAAELPAAAVARLDGRRPIAEQVDAVAGAADGLLAAVT